MMAASYLQSPPATAPWRGVPPACAARRGSAGRKCVPFNANFNFSATVIRFRLAEALLRTTGMAAPGGTR